MHTTNYYLPRERTSLPKAGRYSETPPPATPKHPDLSIATFAWTRPHSHEYIRHASEHSLLLKMPQSRDLAADVRSTGWLAAVVA